MKHIEVQMYDMLVEFHVDKEVFRARYNKLSGNDDPITEEDLNTSYGMTGYNEELGKQVILIFINKDSYRGTLAGMLGTFAHEVFHTVMVMCRRIGHNPTKEDEPMAYLTGYVFREGAEFFIAEFETEQARRLEEQDI